MSIAFELYYFLSNFAPSYIYKAIFSHGFNHKPILAKQIQ